ncbi:acyltransferase family protein [Steroidobacter agaridevorans]|uniref:acyltransferase family protein n=1 Tax=Steroidobacter agaridevorans TaxID=2695856 RepID=UPI00132277A8|nr:acyltransferase [Steroidobacter agaridevorans]GFE91027.1 hypothetical protein GCM10011488_59810 [Steroidobacter agaridevorans]
MRISLSLLEVPNQSGRLSSMEGLRAYAAGVVFLLHVALLAPPELRDTFAVQWLAYGHHGVDIFFLLSGYLIAGMVRKSDFRYWSYLGHRVARIYPALLAMLLLCSLGLFVLRGEVISPLRFVQNVFLLNGIFPLNIKPIDYVTWSVFFEFAFYAVFPLLYRALGLRWALLAALVIIACVYDFDSRYSRFAMFLFGVWLRFHPERTLRIPTPVVIALYLAFTTLTIGVHHEMPTWAYVAGFGVVSYLLVDNTLHAGGALSRLFTWRPLRLIGNISYSFYLLHPTALLIARMLIAPLHLEGWSWLLALAVIGFALSMAMASVSFVLLERPYFLLRKNASRSTADRSGTALGGATSAEG